MNDIIVGNMALKKISLTNFRNFKSRNIEFSQKVTVIVGPNASGKTNILESIYLTSLGKSFRARVEEEMVNYNSEITRIGAKIGINNQSSHSDNLVSESKIDETKLEIILTRGEIEVGDNKFEKAPRKKLLVNGVPRRLIDFAGNLKVVLFAPRDLDLITESPSLRRNFLDNVLSQVDREYRRASLSYEKGLRQRNRLLLRIREEGLSRSQLLFWDRLLIKNGNYITTMRSEFIDFVNDNKSTLDIVYPTFFLEYDSSTISEGRLDQYASEEVASATTLVGPHRDDFLVKAKDNKSKLNFNNRDMSRFGSRGEQRMAVLWLKLTEMEFIKEKTGDQPTLLLDDIFSELDHDHREIVMKITKGQQTIITTADPHNIRTLKKMEIIRL